MNTELDIDWMEDILAQLDWKSGIRPLGDLATEACFVQKEMPIIKRLVRNHCYTMVVTQSSWTNQLVDTGVIDLNDNTTMHALSELHMLFHSRQQQPEHRTLHHLHLDCQAYFSVNRILRPTVKFQNALEAALGQPNRYQAWQELCKVWHDFGFLWPQKLILGYRHHVKHSYQVHDDAERVLQLQIARDHTAALLDMELRKPHTLLHGDSHDMNHIVGQQYHTDQKLQRSVRSWKVIKREELRPIYEFLHAPTCEAIRQLIKSFVDRIPIRQPFLLKSVNTNGYLSCQPNTKLQEQQKQEEAIKKTEHGERVPSQHPDEQNCHYDLAKSARFFTVSLENGTSPDKYSLWQFTDKIDVALASQSTTQKEEPLASTSAFVKAVSDVKATKYVRCGSQLYLTPYSPSRQQSTVVTRSSSCKVSPTSSSSLESDSQSHQLLLGWNPYVEKTSRIKSVQLLDVKTLTSDKTGLLEQHKWTVKSPDLVLRIDDNLSTDSHLNMDIAIGRQKPILDRETISLRQILYLCSVKNQSPLALSTQSAHWRSISNGSHSPPIIIPSPVSPAAAGVMTVLQNTSSLSGDNRGDDDDEKDDEYSHPSVSRVQFDQQKRSATQRGRNSLASKTLISSSSTLPLDSTTANTSQTTLPYCNLYPYTELTPSTSPLVGSPFSASRQGQRYQYQQQKHPVLAKENSLINGLEEAYWIIELLPNSNDHKSNSSATPLASRRTKRNSLTSSQQKQSQLLKKGKKDMPPMSIPYDDQDKMTPNPQRIKVVMSSDTLRDDALASTDDDNKKSSKVRRVQSYSSIQESYLHYSQEQRYIHQDTTLPYAVKHETNQQHIGDGEKKLDMTTLNYRLTSSPSSLVPATNTSSLVTATNITRHHSSELDRISRDDDIHRDIQPYLRLYVSKKNNKTWSQFIKHSSLTNLKRWLKSQ